MKIYLCVGRLVKILANRQREMRKEIIEYTGKIHRSSQKNGGLLITAENGLFFLTKRSPRLSDESAIRTISKYGISQVFWIGQDRILQRYIDFVHLRLSLEDLAALLRKIHVNSEGKKTLVHGDFSRHNTTLINGVPLCFDYEYSHWGDPYVDLGRVVLRECESEEEVRKFFLYYRESIPDSEEIRSGFILFCQRQYEMRCEKNLDFKEVPQIRRTRLEECGREFTEVLHVFKDSVKK